MGMCKGFSTREQRWYQPILDPWKWHIGSDQPAGDTGRPVFFKRIFFPVLLFLVLVFWVYIIILGIKVLWEFVLEFDYYKSSHNAN